MGSSKGELHELRKALHDNSIEKKKDGMRNVIKRMTAGKDASALLPDVVTCMSDNNLELKKLVYLYFLSYVKTQPKLAILAVNAFRNDTQDPSPLIRALAVRTMGCINVKDEENQVTEYLLEPLRAACRDTDPYVRKTAAICIAKLHDIAPEEVEDNGFFDVLRDFHGDSNPMVVANSAVALIEMSHKHGRMLYELSEDDKDKLLAALQECGSEWGQISILDCLCKYQPRSALDAEKLLDRVKGCFAHTNSAVVLSAIRVCMNFLDKVQNEDFVRSLSFRLARPLIASALSEECEIQYVVLKNISIIIKAYPKILQDQVKMFFCKYYDPLYIKMEKLDIIVPLTTDDTLEQVLSELKDYCQEVDVEFVRRAVRSLGRLAIKMGRKADRCVDVLLELIEGGNSNVVNEGVTVMKDVFRRYPGRYERVIGDLCENMDSLEEPETKASMIWIIGEYADRIDGSRDLLDGFVDNFKDEPAEVQISIITATVKCYLLIRRQEEEELLKSVLELSTQLHNPDVRDRGFMYWRLLNWDPEVAKQVVVTDRPVISDGTKLDSLSGMLLQQIGTLSSIYGVAPKAVDIAHPDNQYRTEDDDEMEAAALAQVKANLAGGGRGNDESESSSAGEDSDDDEDDVPPLANQIQPRQVLAPDAQSSTGAQGLEIAAKIVRMKGQIALQMKIRNHTSDVVRDFAAQVQKNAFGLGPGASLDVPPVGPRQEQEATLKLLAQMSDLVSGQSPERQLVLQVALKCTLGVFYLTIPFDLFVCLKDEAPAMPVEQLQQAWTSNLPDLKVPSLSQQQLTPPMVIGRLKQGFMRHVTSRSEQGAEMMYFSCVTTNNLHCILEVSIKSGSPDVMVTAKAQGPPMNPVLIAFVLKLLNLRPKQ